MVKRTIEKLGADYYFDTTEYPTNAIPLTSLNELPIIEDCMIGLIKPNITDEQWNDWGCRTPLEKLIRPKGLYGEIIDPYMAMLDHPYEEMKAALEDPGISFLQGYAIQERSLKNHQFQELAKKCVGFQVLGQIKKQDLPISAQVWYFNAPTKVPGSGGSIRSNKQGEIIRIVATPVEQSEAILKLIKQGKLGTAALGNTVGKPSSGKKSKKSTLK
jgi:hypothetical protein